MKDKLRSALDYIVKHSKIVFPVIVVVVVAVTVSFALNAHRGSAEDVVESMMPNTTSVEDEAAEAMFSGVVPEVELRLNEDANVHSLLATYYNAWALGDMETIQSVCDVVPEIQLLKMQAQSEYIDFYPTFEVYVKDGPEAGSLIAYVSYKMVFVNHEEEIPGFDAYYICTNEQGELYIKTSDNSDAVNDYLLALQAQDDVVEFNNRINVEYNELIMENPTLLSYIEEVVTEVDKAVGVAVAAREASTSQAAEGTESADPATAEGSDPAAEGTGDTPAEATGPVYGTATTTVNVRVSDSENADRIGKVTGGTQLEVLEQKANGWSKVLFEGREGYIKSEYIPVAGSTTGQTDNSAAVGTVTATTNINIRESASETATKLGVLAGGDSAELISEENGWCYIRYNGQTGYVKAEFVQR